MTVYQSFISIGYKRVMIKVGENKTMKIILNTNELAYWNIDANTFESEKG